MRIGGSIGGQGRLNREARENPDYSFAMIADTLTGEQCARFRSRLRPGPFAEYVALLCRWYNWAFLTPEANNAGFIDALINTGYPLDLIYNRRRDPTDRRTARIQEIGFETTGVSRTWLVGAPRTQFAACRFKFTTRLPLMSARRS